MCRVLTYLGQPITLEDLIYKPDNSLIKQTYNPLYMSHLLNLAGFGVIAWDYTSFNKKIPFIYKTEQLPLYDENLRNITQKVRADCLLTHVRGVPYTERNVISKQNVHPFIFENTQIAFAHNGYLHDFEKMKYELIPYINPEYQDKINGSTDSEWLYATFLSQLDKNVVDPSVEEIMQAVINTFIIFKKIRYKLNIRVNSPVNIFITNGKFIAATRFVFDYGWLPLREYEESSHFSYHSLWYTYGDSYINSNNEYFMKGSDKKLSLIISSEPLTQDNTTWIEVPEYTFIIAHFKEGEIEIISKDININ